MNDYFPELNSLEGRAKVEQDLSNYRTKADLKIATGVDRLKLTEKVDLTRLINQNLMHINQILINQKMFQLI